MVQGRILEFRAFGFSVGLGTTFCWIGFGGATQHTLVTAQASSQNNPNPSLYCAILHYKLYYTRLYHTILILYYIVCPGRRLTTTLPRKQQSAKPNPAATPELKSLGLT